MAIASATNTKRATVNAGAPQLKVPPRKKGVNGEKLSEVVFDHVVRNIRSGKYLPSDKISLVEIAQELNVSAMPVRNAMEKLEEHGWVERRPQSGTYIKDFDPQEIQEIYEIREMIEAQAVCSLCERYMEKELTRLEEIVDHMEAAAEEKDGEKFAQFDRAFHRYIVYCQGNRKLDRIYESILLQSLCFYYNHAAMKLSSEANLQFRVPSHREIYEAIKARKNRKAEQLLRKHIRVSAEWNKTIANVRRLGIS